MTYKQLLEELKRFSEDQLALSVTYYDSKTYYPVDIVIANEVDSEDILGCDIPHPVIVIKENEEVIGEKK